MLINTKEELENLCEKYKLHPSAFSALEEAFDMGVLESKIESYEAGYGAGYLRGTSDAMLEHFKNN